IERPDAVNSLQAHEALQPQLGLGVGEALAVLDRLAIRHTHHVIVKDNAAHPRQLGTAGLERTVGAFQGLLSSLINLLLGGFVSGIIKSAVAPVTVGAEHARSL